LIVALQTELDYHRFHSGVVATGANLANLSARVANPESFLFSDIFFEAQYFFPI